MNGLLLQLGVNLRLHFRNKMGLLYTYLFPVIFLVVFWVLYRYESVPLARHVGELLTVTVLGSACFGLPTTMVSERERGVWRRYRLAPVSTGVLVSSVMMARYFIVFTAGMLQLALAMVIGMPLPPHLFDLWVTFTFVSFAFLGLGLVIATMADTVPAVQALGQCIFLPMLVIGGVAVQLASLPEWAQHMSAFFPGRYAVDAMQVCVTGDGLREAGFNLLALLLIGTAGCVTGAKMFRWDAQQKFFTRQGKGWVAVSLSAWVAVGMVAESRGTVLLGITGDTEIPPAVRTEAQQQPANPRGPVPPAPEPEPAKSELETAVVEPAPVAPEVFAPTPEPEPREGESAGANPPEEIVAEAGPSEAPTETLAPDTETAVPEPAQTATTMTAEERTGPPSSWQEVTRGDVDQYLSFDKLPPDDGVVSPLAFAGEEPEEELVQQLLRIQVVLPNWEPGQVEDQVQRVRNFLFVAAVPDVFQIPVERFVPWLVYQRLQEDIPEDQLIQLLYWVAQHPNEGTDTAVDNLWRLGMGNGPEDMETTRERVTFYALKLLGRLTGKIAWDPVPGAG